MAFARLEGFTFKRQKTSGNLERKKNSCGDSREFEEISCHAWDAWVTYTP